MRLRLKELLKEQERSIYWLQQQTGIQYTTLRNYFHNKAVSINLGHIALICTALNCTPDDLFGPTKRRRK